MKPPSRPAILLLVKVLVSAGLLSFLLSQIELRQLLRVLFSAQVPYLVLCLAGYLFGQILCSVRWALLARPLGFGNPFKDFALFYFIGMFFNLFAPSTVGGDIGRVFYLARDGTQSRETSRTGAAAPAFVTVIADRVIGLAVLLWVGAVGLFVFPAYSLPSAIRYATFALALGVFLGWLLLPLLMRLLPDDDHPLIKNLRLTLGAFRNFQRILAPAVVISLTVHFLQAAIHVLVGRALGFHIPWSYSLILYPLVGVFSAIPVSFNGIGLREGGYLFMLRQIEIDSEKAVAFGLLWFMIIALDSLIGGASFILGRSPRPLRATSGTAGQAK